MQLIRIKESNPPISVRFLLVILHFTATASSPLDRPRNGTEEDPAVTNLRTYLKFRTDPPNPDRGYEQSIQFLKEQANEIGLNFTVVKMESPNLFAVCMSWEGTNPELKSVLLNSHMDVVPVDPSNWMYPPFSAYKDAQGRIYARGASDMKSKTIGELEALRRLKRSGFIPLRSIHITVLPDEETGGLHGMKPFVETKFFKDLNVGVDIDEGGVIDNATKTMYIIVAEKTSWKFNITARGKSMHGSLLPRFTAAERLRIVIDRLSGYRQQQYLKLSQPNTSLENVTTINLVQLGGGTAPNVIPKEVWATFDMRILVEPHWTFSDVDKMLDKILKEASLGAEDPNENVTIHFMLKPMETGRTIADDINPWWINIQKVCKEIKLTCKPQILSPATDARYIRNLGISAFGLSPFVRDLAHVDNEFVAEEDFLNAIDIYEKVIRSFSMELEAITRT